MEEFLKQLAEILELEEIFPDTNYRELDDWDSLAVLSVIALVDSKYGVTLKAEDLRKAANAGALYEIIEARKK